MTNNLLFSKHINNISLNVSRITGSLGSIQNFVPGCILLKLFYSLALPYLTNHIVVWGAAPASHLSNLNVRVNNLLRLILGVKWVNGRPTLGNRHLYKILGILNVNSLFKFNLFKFLKLLLEGKAPEFFEMLLQPHLRSHSYETRRGMFQHPNLTYEDERRDLGHQLIPNRIKICLVIS